MLRWKTLFYGTAVFFCVTVNVSLNCVTVRLHNMLLFCGISVTYLCIVPSPLPLKCKIFENSLRNGMVGSLTVIVA